MRQLLPFLLVAVLLGAAATRDAFDRWVDQTQLPPLVYETSTEMRDRNGELLRAYTVDDGRWRLGAGVTQVDPTYLRMLIAYEDKRFYSHAGVDIRAALRAAFQALRYGHIVSGGSTLSMQVARLTESSGTGSWRGKLRQVRVALALERRLSKNEILNLYLTLAPFGGNLEGVRAATLAYLGKEPARLTAAQAALLVAIPQSPAARRPDRDASAATAARDRVLIRMISTGVLTAEASHAAQLDPVEPRKRPFPALAAHLGDRARKLAPLQKRHLLTIDATLQRKLEKLARDSLRNKAENLSIAIMLADHQTGQILASVGSAGYAQSSQRQGFVDMTQALRSPGSTLKPLIYAMGFDQGLVHPETLINDRPVAFGGYAPQNFDGAFRGEIRVAEALKLSLNIPVVLLTHEIGPARLMAAMRRAGMQPRIQGARAGLAVALGGVGVTLEDLVRLYAALANGGDPVALHWRQGERPNKPASRLISRAAAWQVGHILADMVPPPGAPHQRLAYKTGTSYGHRDAWAVGFDGRHVAGVWVGRPDGTPVPGAFGGEVAAPILFEAFQRTKPTLEPLPVPPPETMLVGASALPQPLRRFRGREALFAPQHDAPKLAFPAHGSIVVLEQDGLAAKIRDGQPPFTWLADGAPILTRNYGREVFLNGLAPGFVTLSVIDGQGRSARSSVELR